MQVSPAGAATLPMPLTAQTQASIEIRMLDVYVDPVLWNLASDAEKGVLLRDAHDAAYAALYQSPPDGGGGNGGGGNGGGLLDPNVRPKVGPAGAAIGFVTGAVIGGHAYIAAHGLTDGGSQASFGGFLWATLGGGFAGAVGGAFGGYGFMVASSALGALSGVMSSWEDHRTGGQTPQPK